MFKNKLKKQGMEQKNLEKIEGKYTFSTMVEDGKTFILRFRQSLWHIVDDNIFPYQVGIAMPIKQPENEFPGKNENKLLLLLEKRLRLELEKNSLAIFAGAIIGDGMKKLVFYTRAPEEVKVIMEKLKKDIEGYSIQMIIQTDKEWKVFRIYCPLI